MKVPLGAEHMCVTNPAQLRWLTATDLRLRPWPDPPALPTRPLMAYDKRAMPDSIGEKRNADGSVNFDYLDAGRWWEKAEAK